MHASHSVTVTYCSTVPEMAVTAAKTSVWLWLESPDFRGAVVVGLSETQTQTDRPRRRTHIHSLSLSTPVSLSLSLCVCVCSCVLPGVAEGVETHHTEVVVAEDGRFLLQTSGAQDWGDVGQ